MGIFIGYLGLTVAFLIIISLLLYIIIGSKGRLIPKLIIISLSIWYAVVLLSTPANFLGWASHKEPFHNSVILWYEVNELKGDKDNVAVYMMTRPLEIDKHKPGTIHKWTAGLLFEARDLTISKYHRIVISKKEYKELVKKNQEADKRKRMLIYKGKKGKSRPGFRGGINRAPGETFDTIDPRTLMPPKDEVQNNILEDMMD